MQVAKFLTRLISCTLLFLSCSSKNASTDDLQLLSLSTQMGSWKSVPPQRFVSVITTLTNNTSDTLRYVSMSCSWQDAFIIDTKKLNIYPVECDKNVPELIAIPPYGQEQKALAVVTEKSMEELRNIKFRIGFNWLAAKDYNEVFEKVEQMNDMTNVVWSDPLKIQ